MNTKVEDLVEFQAPYVTGNHAIKKLSWWHESIIDWMLANPEQTLGACALIFNVSQAWLSRIINSALFKERLAYRREHHSEHVSYSIADKLNSLAEVGLETLTERIMMERETIPLPELRAASELALNAMGYSPKGGPAARPGASIVQINVVNPQALNEARRAWEALANVEEPSVGELQHDGPTQLFLEPPSGTGAL